MRTGNISKLCTAKPYEGRLVKIDFEKLINDYGRQVLNTAIRILHDRQKALDVHQQVFLEIWRRWHTFNSRTNWSAYLYRTTVREAIAFAKKTREKNQLQLQPEYADKKQNPTARLETEELQQKITACLDKLPSRQAEVFALSKIEGLKTEKIAQMLDCSKDTVRVHIHRAIKKIAAELGDYLKI